MKSKLTMARHGDVLITAVDRLPKGAVKKAPFGPRILMEGEATGHAHRVDQGEIFMVGEQMYFRAPKGGAALTHEEHARIDLPKGVYEITRQREYVAPAVTRNVVD